MKKRISCFLLAAFMAVTTCFTGISAMVFASNKEDTSVTKVSLMNDSMAFYLSNNDYSGAPYNNSSATGKTEYNFWTNIKIYTSDTSFKSLQESYDARTDKGKTTFYRLWTHENTFAVALDSDSLSNAKKVVIPSGTEFPAYAYTSGSISEKKSYVTTEDITYTRDGETWSVYVAPVTAKTSITKIDTANDAFRFYLSENDYGNTVPNDSSATTFTDFNYWNQILIYTSADTYQTLKQSYDARTDKGKTTFYNLWTAWGTFAVGADTTSLTSATKVVIPAGTQFPSMQYTTGAISSKKCYETEEEVVFVKNGSEWKISVNTGIDMDKVTSTPANGETVNLLSGGIYDFVTNYEKGDSDRYSTKNDCYAPAGVKFTWSELSGVTEYILEVSNSDSMICPKTYKSSTNTLTIDDLLAGKTYFYRIKVKDGETYKTSSVFSFKTKELPRTISIDGASNTRDLGGYLTEDGKYRVRQEMIYRGANVDNLTTQGKSEFLEKYGIKTDLDVRGDKKRSPLGDSVNYVSTVGPQYIQIADEQYKEALATELRTFADSSNYPIYFHCQIGRDRTGTLAFLLNALLGVSEQDIYMDYELSMFSAAGWADNTPVASLVDKHFYDMVEYIKKYQSGTLKENTEAFVKKDLGITSDEISAIRNLMLEETGNTASYDTEISKVQVRAGKLIVFPETMDYDAAGHSTKLDKKLDKYQILDSVVLYKSENEKATLREVYDGNAWYNVWDTDDSIAFDLKSGWDGKTIKKIIFNPGTTIPSYHYTNGDDAVKTSFVLRTETVFTTNTSADVNLDWTAEDNSVPVKTSVSGIQTGHNGMLVTFYLSNTDYDGLATATVHAKHTQYNYLNKIRVYTDAQHYVTLAEAYDESGQKYYNMWGREDTLSISLQESYFASACRIVIPQGTVFPSAKYTNSGASKKAGFVVKEELVFDKPASGQNWSVVDTSTPDDTAITKLLSGHNATILTFYLSQSDYENNKKVGSTHVDYNYWEQIRLYTDDTNYTTLKDAYKTDGQIFYNMWTRANTFSIEIDPTIYANIVKVFVPEGTVFPSYAHTNNGATYKYGYVTKKDNTFGKPKNATEGGEGYQWNSLNPAVNYDTVVSKIQVRDVSGKLFLFLSDNDYADIGSNIKIGNQLESGNILEQIVVYRTDNVSKKLSEIYTGESYYNLWGEQGCIALDLEDGWDGTNIAKVVIPAGCEFPSYRYTSGALYDRTFYRTKYETIFTSLTYPENGYDNISYVQQMIVPSQAVTTTVSGVTLLGGTQDIRLIIALDNQDYDSAADSEACLRKFADYNTLESIELYKGSKKVTLADAVNTEEVYYNLWGRSGTISYGLKSKYKIDSFDKIVIKNGCEFPAYSYTQTDSVEKVAYTVTTEKEMTIGHETYKVSYYDTNNRLLYTDEVVSGTTLVLRNAPKKAGYEASWSGMTYSLMPAQDISYVLSYTKYSVTEEDKQNEAEKSDTDSGQGKDESTSPKTGDMMKMAGAFGTMMLAGAVLAVVIYVKKKTENQMIE